MFSVEVALLGGGEGVSTRRFKTGVKVTVDVFGGCFLLGGSGAV